MLVLDGDPNPLELRLAAVIEHQRAPESSSGTMWADIGIRQEERDAVYLG